MYPDWVLNWGVSDETPLQVPTFIAQQASHNSKVTCLQGIREGPGMTSQLKVYLVEKSSSNKAKRSAKQLRSSVLNALACYQCFCLFSLLVLL